MVTKMGKRFFFKTFIKNPSSIGAVYPTSSVLSGELTSKIGLSKAATVVELGPGTGAITPHIVKKLHSNARFLAIERDKGFYEYLKEKYPTIDVHHEDAVNLDKILKKNNIKSADAIISALPWTTLPESVQDNLLNAVKENLSENGYFTTIAYITGVFTKSGKKFKKKLQENFSEFSVSRLRFRNIPPAFVYRCKK